ncbi:hypothetical protein AOL_s00091g67 [Orbilia oligospora ATCC 24927]|uniref:Uncharacterized protein n=1 Tax=Arthrobotrys oligospora (strain ATCC 24927 / CBS 115.81 / DSM 1491) TaxID=756982 RepID=G1XI15_ARTOA|nr:hypothetical protein AOL_s00091g67 [Orbilia oligospora ATCC 24927]EGX47246.1 hypothetical protein AOL_s00091g67 [Orbilia oligospora ATCC 24927]
MHHMQETPILDTSVEHDHPIDSTHDPTQGRSPTEENRRTSAGEILLSETDTAWPNTIPSAGSEGAESESASSPTSSPLGSRAEAIRRNRRDSSDGSIDAHNGSSVGTINLFNVISKSQAGGIAGNPVISGRRGKVDTGSWRNIINLKRDKKKQDENGCEGGKVREGEKGEGRGME